MNFDPVYLLIPAVIGAGLLVALLVLVSRRMQRDTARRSGDWGINTDAVYCPECGERAPAARFPKSWTEALWGGWTCTNCGTEFDKWGVARDAADDEE